MNRKRLIFGLVIIILMLLPLTGKAIEKKEYPTKMIRFIHGYAAGGTADLQTRMLLPFVQKHLGETVMLENMPGANSILASNKVFTSPADGYTLLVANTAMILQEMYFSETAHYRTREFTHIYRFVKEDTILLSHPEIFKSFTDFYKAAQGRRLRMGMGGTATYAHLVLIMLEEAMGVKFNIIPFSGGGESRTALAGKHIDSILTFVSGAYGMVKSGSLSPLMILSDQRLPTLPETPIPKDVGLRFELLPYSTGILGPPKMPAAIVKVLEEAFAKALKEPEFLEKAEKTAINVSLLNSRDYLAETEAQYSVFERYFKKLKEREK